MFSGCPLNDIKPLENWNVSNGTNFSNIFRSCESIKDVKPLENWNVSNGTNFSYMFSYCSNFYSIKSLKIGMYQKEQISPGYLVIVQHCMILNH